MTLAGPTTPYDTIAALANFAWCQKHGYTFRFAKHPSHGEIPSRPPPPLSKIRQQKRKAAPLGGAPWKGEGLWHAADQNEENPYQRSHTYWKSFEMVEALQDDTNNPNDWVIILDIDAIIANHSLTYRQVLGLDDALCWR
mmetsp:Transcript_9850/g.21392  ORF Transcript_9850/g.21392 Transcript_9850/m.21392 type:complete len:140 (-) Transcript_9850:11-430(-)